MIKAAKELRLVQNDGYKFDCEDILQLYIFGNALIVTWGIDPDDLETRKFMLRDLRSLSVEF